MHYGDANQLALSNLVVIIYKHSTPDEGVFDYEITAISQCSYISVRLLKSVLNDPNPYFKDALKDCIAERWYSVTILTPEEDFKVVIDKFIEVTDSDGELMRVH